jgi:hypothetical protein
MLQHVRAQNSLKAELQQMARESEGLGVVVGQKRLATQSHYA